MRTTRLGRTGLVVSRLCLGMMTYGAQVARGGCSTRRRAARS